MSKKLKSNFLSLYFAWIISLIAAVISVYFGEVQGVEPCRFCWYLRMCIFPLVFLFPMIYYDENKRAVKYTLPFSLLGLILSFYQLVYKTTLCPQNGACLSLHLTQTLSILGMLCFMFIFLFTIFTLFKLSKISPDE